jgi:hypothetical protein
LTETPPQRYPYFGVPPPKVPRPASEEPTLRGKRVVLSMPDGFVYDMRAASEAYTDGDGSALVDIVSEEDWFRWMFTKEPPERRQFRLHLVWVE